MLGFDDVLFIVFVDAKEVFFRCAHGDDDFKYRRNVLLVEFLGEVEISGNRVECFDQNFAVVFFDVGVREAHGEKFIFA